jgi:hypothetical protein
VRPSGVSGKIGTPPCSLVEGGRGRGFPVAKRAGRDAQLGGGLLLCHPLAEQLRRPLLLSSSLLSAAALIGELLLRPRPQLLAPAGSDPPIAGGGRPQRRAG